MSHDHHDTVVVEDRDSGSGMGAILGIIAIIVLLGAVWYFALGPGAGSTAPAGSGGSTTPAQTQEAPVPTDAPAAS